MGHGVRELLPDSRHRWHHHRGRGSALRYHARKRAEEALLLAHDELEERVAERTADLARANESLRAEVSERRLAEQARNELLRRLVVVQEEERARIARELHDQMGQQLTALKLGLESLECRPLEGTAPVDRLRQMLALTRQIGHDMHRIAWELGPAALEGLDLPTALSNYAEEWSQHAGIAGAVSVHGAVGRAAFTTDRDDSLPGRAGGADQRRQTCAGGSAELDLKPPR